MALINTLLPFQKELLTSIAKSGSYELILSPARRFGKSAITNAIPPGATGTKPDMIWFDELVEDAVWFGDGSDREGGGLSNVTFKTLKNRGDPDEVCKFADPRYPAATVTVRREGLDKRDPRNPNPSAPAGHQFFIYVAGRKSHRGYGVEKLARIQAGEIFKTLVRRLEAKELEPIAGLENFGRF